MRRSTAAAVGTLTGAALIVGVRLSVSAAGRVRSPHRPPSTWPNSGRRRLRPRPRRRRSRRRRSRRRRRRTKRTTGRGRQSGLKDGIFKGRARRTRTARSRSRSRSPAARSPRRTRRTRVTGDSATINPAGHREAQAGDPEGPERQTSTRSPAPPTPASRTSKSLQAAFDAANGVGSRSVRHVEHVMGTAVSIDLADDLPPDRPARDDRRRVRVAARGGRAVQHVQARTARSAGCARREISAGDCSADLRHVLDACADLWRETDGYFDAYAAGPLDPSGYVKGWSVEVASARLAAAGSVGHCINAGGDIRMRGGNPDGRAVAGRHPAPVGGRTS